jgi:transcription-repair coupling factor (superfamily II helicase)
LVCTTIIENGLDISNANTIIVNDADRMGLSQLYQLRGRVGRGARVAYAYLMYRKDKVLSEVSEKRLQTIKEFTEFGSGFKIAMRDLEIRGAGNLLGAEQHGYIDAVGYDMYCKLLSDEIKKQRGEKPEKTFETAIDIEINAHLPDFYIKNEEQKLEIYKKIALMKTRGDYNDIQEEIEDRYGDLPQPAQNLLDVALLKADAHDKGVTSVTQNKNAITITFKADANVNPENAVKLVREQNGRLSFKTSFPPAMVWKIDELNIKGLSELINRL